MIRPLLLLLVLDQATATNLVDPSVPSRKANIDSCTGGKSCLDVKVVEGLPQTQATSMADGGVPASEASASTAAAELATIRRLLEQLVALQEQQLLEVQRLKEPGR